MRHFFVILNGRKVGPYPHQEIVRAVQAGRIERDAQVLDEASEKTFSAGELADNPPVDPKPTVHIPTSGGQPKQQRKWLLNDRLVSDEEAIAAMMAEEARLRVLLREQGLPDNVPIFKHDPATTLDIAYREGGGRVLPVPGVPQNALDDSGSATADSPKPFDPVAFITALSEDERLSLQLSQGVFERHNPERRVNLVLQLVQKKSNTPVPVGFIRQIEFLLMCHRRLPGSAAIPSSFDDCLKYALSIVASVQVSQFFQLVRRQLSFPAVC